MKKTIKKDSVNGRIKLMTIFLNNKGDFGCSIHMLLAFWQALHVWHLAILTFSQQARACLPPQQARLLCSNRFSTYVCANQRPLWSTLHPKTFASFCSQRSKRASDSRDNLSVGVATPWYTDDEKRARMRHWWTMTQPRQSKTAPSRLSILSL